MFVHLLVAIRNCYESIQSSLLSGIASEPDQHMIIPIPSTTPCKHRAKKLRHTHNDTHVYN
uniref:Secreted protein n=1 Tax=Heterorhabditis bacteriophora TaxID=37862 RepID=A0A1I7WMC2_HETBA